MEIYWSESVGTLKQEHLVSSSTNWTDKSKTEFLSI